MASGQRSNARWVAVALVGALAACAIVVYALVRLTGSSSIGDTAEPSTDVTDVASIQSSTASESDGAHTISDSTAATAPVDAPTSSQTGSGSPSGTSNTDSMLLSPFVPPTTSSQLPSSQVMLPASWSGTAKVTVAVRGECASVSPSVYRDMPADLALDLLQNEANSAAIGLPEDANPGDVTLTLGINPTGVPALAVYSSQIDGDGHLQRYWRLELTPDGDHTIIHGTLINQSGDGTSPNTLIDAETSLQPCESAGTVSFPKLLAQGATLNGWISDTHASMTLHAATTDGKRQVDVEFEADRKQ